MAIRARSTGVSHILEILAAFLLTLLLVPTSRAQSSGSTKWMATFDMPGGVSTPAAIANDSQGNVYVTGEAGVNGIGNYCPPPKSCNQAVTIKYDPSGKALWKDWLSTGTAGIETGTVAAGMDIALDSAGNTYVFFTFTHPLAADHTKIVPEVVTAKYNPAGGRDWINFIDSSREVGGVQRTPVQMAVSPEGNVYVIYNQGLPTSTPTTVVMKYDTAGHAIWSQSVNDDPQSRAVAIALDAKENIYVDLYLSSPSTQNDGEIIKFNPSGTRLATFGRGQIGFASAFHVDPDGACYFSGRGANTGSSLPDLVVAKFNPDQSLAYLVDITKLESGLGADLGPGSGPNGGLGPITSDSLGDAFVLQHFDQTGPAATGSVISVLKLDRSGHEVFVTRYNGQADESGNDHAGALAVSPSGDVYLTGSSQLQEPPSNEYGFVTIKYDNAGVRQWVEQYTSPSQFAIPKAMALSGGNLVVTGSSFNNSESAWATIDYVP